MKVKVDRTNKIVLAIGSYDGKRIIARAICNEDEFDEEFGKQLAEARYKVKLNYQKIRKHQKIWSALNAEINRLSAIRSDQVKCISYLCNKHDKLIGVCDEIIDKKFN